MQKNSECKIFIYRAHFVWLIGKKHTFFVFNSGKLYNSLLFFILQPLAKIYKIPISYGFKRYTFWTIFYIITAKIVNLSIKDIYNKLYKIKIINNNYKLKKFKFIRNIL